MSLRELDRAIVANAPDAARVEAVLRLLPDILLQHDPRVQAVYAAWRQRIDDEAPRPSSYTWPAVTAWLVVDLQAIVVLINDLGGRSMATSLMGNYAFHKPSGSVGNL